MLIPWQQLAPDTLDRLIEAFVLREGTDYGDAEVSLQEKVQHVRTQLEHGQVLIVYSQTEESVDLLTKQQYRQLAEQIAREESEREF
jgi:uncharacterized protein YheU (UPF0270 family)